jgi:Mannosyltransferase (PIG-V)
MPSLLERVRGAASHALRPDGPWRFVLAVWLGSRAFFFAVGAVAVATLQQVSPGGLPREPGGVLNYWAHWDGGWYCAIATQGYFNPPSTSFFPGYPILIWLATHLVGGPALWGVVISVVALLFALFFIYELAEDFFDERVARAATLAFAFFPSAFFLNAVYTESLFVMTTAGALWALRVRGNLILACVLAYAAMVTRNVGVLLLIPLAHEWWRRRRELGWSGGLVLALTTSSLAAWMLVLWRGLGDPLYFAVAQKSTWGRALTAPWKTIPRAWDLGLEHAHFALSPHLMLGGNDAGPAFKAADTFSLLFFGVAIVLFLVAFARLPIGLAAYSFLAMLVPVLTPSPFWPLTSFSRYLLAAFPLFIALGVLLARNRYALIAWLIGSAVLGAYLTACFTTWRWVA